MLYNLHINQLAFSQYEKLDYRHCIIFDAMHKIFTTFTKIQKIYEENETWYWLNYDLLLSQIPLLKIGKDQIRNLIKDLASYNLISINPNNQKHARTYFCLGNNAETIFRPLEKIPDPSEINSRPPLEKIPEYNKQDIITNDNKENFYQNFGSLPKPKQNLPKINNQDIIENFYQDLNLVKQEIQKFYPKSDNQIFNEKQTEIIIENLKDQMLDYYLEGKGKKKQIKNMLSTFKNWLLKIPQSKFYSYTKPEQKTQNEPSQQTFTLSRSKFTSDKEYENEIRYYQQHHKDWKLTLTD